MAKPKNPLLSLGASGTIGDTLTFQKRHQATIARKKPIPAYRYTLPQAYQRWDYRDYAYQWTLLTDSEKQVYQTRASRYHITGYSLWMREQLNTLPDLVARWHLDTISNSITPDSSKNTNHGTVYGASLTKGLIDQCLLLDGEDDYVNCGTNPSLYTPTFTYEVFFKPSALKLYGTLISVGVAIWTKGAYITTQANGTLDFGVMDGTTHKGVTTPAGTISIDTWYYCVATFDGSTMELFIDNTSFGTSASNPIVYDQSRPALQSRLWTALPYYFPGLIDHAVIHNRVLDLTEIKRHSERRYL